MDKIRVAYQYIQKDMYSPKQSMEIAVATLIKRKGSYLELSGLRGDLTWDIHESNVVAIFKDNHKIWDYLYL